MNYEFEVSEQAAQPVLSVRKVTSAGNLPQELGLAYKAIVEYMNELGEHPVGMPFAAYYNMDMQNLDTEMGFPVAKPIPGKGNIAAGEIPGGKQVSVIHKGPYKEIGLAYEALMKWVNDNGYAPTGAAYEFYLNSPMEVPESELLTKLMFPVS